MFLKNLIQQIEFQRKCTEIESTEEITKARKTRLLAQAEARETEAQARKVEAEAQARKARLLVEAEEAEAFAELRLKKAYLEAEEKLAAFEGSSLLATSTKLKPFSSSRSRARRHIDNLCVKSKNDRRLAEQNIESEFLPVKPKVSIAREKLVKASKFKSHTVMNRFDGLSLNDKASENRPTVCSRDWQPSASQSC